MSKVVIVPFEMKSVAGDFDRKADELDRAAQAIQSPGLVAGLPPAHQATVAAQLRGIAGQLRGLADRQRAIASDLRRRAQKAMQDTGFQRLLRDGGAIALRVAVEKWANARDKKQLAALEARKAKAIENEARARRRGASRKEMNRLRRQIRRADKALDSTRSRLADEAFEAVAKANSKIKNTAFEALLKLGGAWSGNQLLDTIAKINKVRRDIKPNLADAKKAWKQSDPLTLEDLKKTSKGVRKLPIVSTATLPWAYSDAQKALKDQKYTGTKNKIERINDAVNMGGVVTQGVGAGAVGVGAGLSATGVGAVVGVPMMAAGGTAVAVGEGVQVVSLGADVGLIVWDQTKHVGKAWKWVSSLG